jgi:hypothetical protein
MKKALATCSAIAALILLCASPAGAARGEPNNPCWDVSGQGDLSQDHSVQDFVNPFTGKQTQLENYSQTWTATIDDFKNGAGADQSKCSGLTYTALVRQALDSVWASAPTPAATPTSTNCSSSATSAQCSWASGQVSYALIVSNITFQGATFGALECPTDPSSSEPCTLGKAVGVHSVIVGGSSVSSSGRQLDDGSTELRDGTSGGGYWS